MEPAHGGEVGGQTFAVSLLQLLAQELDVSRDCFFRGLLFVWCCHYDGGTILVGVLVAVV